MKILIYILLILFLLNLNNAFAVEKKFDIINPFPTSSDAPVNDSPFDFDILNKPIFPSIISIPSAGDVFIRKNGFAFMGSNPSFEIRFNKNVELKDIKSVDLKDSQNKLFKNLQFFLIPSNQDTYIFSLKIPNTVSLGASKIFLNSPKPLYGEIEIIDSLHIFSNNLERAPILSPSVRKISYIKTNDTYDVMIVGIGFAPESVFYLGDNIKNNFIELKSENTKITIFPKSLNIVASDINVQNNNLINFKIGTNPNITDKTKLTLVIATPRGISSKNLILSK